MGTEGLEVWDDKLLPEGLGKQDDVALDTSKTGHNSLGLELAYNHDSEEW